MDVFGLAAKLTLDSSQYDESLESAEKKSSSFGSNLGKALGVGAGVAVGAVTAVTTRAIGLEKALVSATNDVASYGDTIDKQSQKLGISAEAYQEWDAILQHSGSSVAALTPAMKTLDKQLEAGSEAFDQLNISSYALEHLSKEELFSTVVSRLQGIEDESERTALASELLGKSYMELGPLLNTSAEDTEAMRQAVHDLGGVMSDEAVKDAAAYQDAMQDMNTAIDGVKRSMISEFMPGITTVMNGVAELFSGDSDQGVAQITTGLDALIDNLLTMAPQLASTGAKLLTSLLTGLVQKLPEIIIAGFEVVTSLVEGLLSGDSISQIISAVIDLFFEITTWIIDNLDEFITLGIQVVESLATGLLDNLPAIINGITTLLLAIVNFLTGDGLMTMVTMGLQLVFALVNGIIANLPAIIQAAVQLVVSLVTGLIENIPQIITAAIELIGGLIVGLIEAIPDIIAALPQIFDAIITAFTEVDWATVGSNIIDGVVNGIVAAASRLWEAAKNAVKGAVDAVKDFLEISSPSRLMKREVGYMMDMGVAGGIDEGADEVVDAAVDLSDSAVAAMDVGGGSGGYDFSGGAGNDSMRALMEEVVEAISSLKVYLDTGVLVGELTPALDTAFGQMVSDNARYN